MSTAFLDEADEDAARAAIAGGIAVRELTSLADCQAAEAVCNEVFSPDAGTAAVTVEWMRVLAKTGNYVGGTFEGEQLIGLAVGLRSGVRGESLHSHVAAVLGSKAGRGVGFALKLHQRAWAVRKEMTSISWTFDPLVRRNAHLNLSKLGAQPDDYLRNFYGNLRDARNGDDETDRILLEWSLGDERVRTVCRGERLAPVAVDGDLAMLLEVNDDETPRRRKCANDLVGVAVPADIEALRQSRPAVARDWRLAVRETLAAELAAGARCEGFLPEGVYVLSRGGR